MKAGQRLENEVLMLYCGRPICAVKGSSGFLGGYGNRIVEIEGLAPLSAKASLKRSLLPSMPAKHPWGCADEFLGYTGNVLIKRFVKSLAEGLTRQRHRGVLIQALASA